VAEREGEGAERGIVDLKPSLKPLQTLLIKDLSLNNNNQPTHHVNL